MNRQVHAHDLQRVRALAPLRDFLHTESAGAVLLVSGAIFALLWSNSPWSASYESLWNSRIALTIAGHSLELDLRRWVNDGLMTIFFFVVGLEIKREVIDGHLAERRAAFATRKCQARHSSCISCSCWSCRALVKGTRIATYGSRLERRT